MPYLYPDNQTHLQNLLAMCNTTLIESTAQAMANNLRAGTAYHDAFLVAVQAANLQPLEWVAVIKRVEELRKMPSAPTDEKLVSILMEVIPITVMVDWGNLTKALQTRIVGPNWLTVRRLLGRLVRDGVLRYVRSNNDAECWQRLR